VLGLHGYQLLCLKPWILTLLHFTPNAPQALWGVHSSLSPEDKVNNAFGVLVSETKAIKKEKHSDSYHSKITFVFQIFL
jgi:hypothetical protein